jgi:hypothetical protein
MTWTHLRAGTAYYVDELVTLIYCTALGGVALAIQQQGLLRAQLPGSLHLGSLAAAIVLLTLVILRLCMMWMVATNKGDHKSFLPVVDVTKIVNVRGRDPSWMPLRYVILLAPLALYFMGFLNPTFTAADKPAPYIQERTPRELVEWASGPQRRATAEGAMVRVQGLFAGGNNDSWFSLVGVRPRQVHPDADMAAIPVLIDESKAKHLPNKQRILDSKKLNHKWVEVTGRIQFRQQANAPDVWFTIVVVEPSEQRPLQELIKQVSPQNPYE